MGVEWGGERKSGKQKGEPVGQVYEKAAYLTGSGKLIHISDIYEM